MGYKKYKNNAWNFECSTCKNIFIGTGTAWYYRKNLCTRIGETGYPSDYNCDICANSIESI